MDERQTHIKEGAGLEESRLNVEFIEFLRKWSTPVLFVIAAVLLGFVVFQRLEQSRLARVDEAFVDLESASSPDSLRSVAEDYDGVRAVGVLARLEAADLYLSSVRRGVKAGAEITVGGEVANEDDLLDDATRDLYLTRAEELFSDVLQKARGKESWALHEVNALFGLAAVSESRSDTEAARGHYRAASDAAESAGFMPLSRVAQHRLDSLADLEMPKLYARAEIAPLPGAEPVEVVVPESEPLPGPTTFDDPMGPTPEAPEGTADGGAPNAGDDSQAPGVDPEALSPSADDDGDG